MRRFEREVDGTRRFWEVDLQGTELRFHTGTVGRAARTRVQRERTLESAAAALARAVDLMVSNGWTEATDPLLEAPPPADAAPLPHPDDLGAFLVLADRLQAQGDPRGELIAVQIALEAEGPPDRELYTTQDRLLAQLRPAALPEGLEVGWRRGFLSILVLPQDGYGAEPAAILEALADDGELPLLTELATYGDGSADPMGMALARRTWPTLRSLSLAGPLSVPLGRVLAGMPALEQASIGRLGAVGPIAAPHLVQLHLGIDHGSGLGDLADGELPSLESLWLRRTPGRPGGGVHIDRGALGRLVERPLAMLSLDQGVLDELVGVLRAPPPWAWLEIVDGERPADLADALITLAPHLAGVPVRVRGELPDPELEAIRAVLPVKTDLPDIRSRADVVLISASQEVLRRFERLHRGSTRYWEIVREGAEVVVRHGLVGSPGATRRTAYPDPESAAGAYRRKVRGKVAEGWTAIG